MRAALVDDLIWELLTGALWVAGAIADVDARLVLWGLAVVCAYGGAGAQLGFTVLAFGAPALFLLAQLLFHRAALGYVPRSRPVGMAALVILAVVTAPFTLIVGIAASTAVVVAVAIADTVPARGRTQVRPA